MSENDKTSSTPSSKQPDEQTLSVEEKIAIVAKKAKFELTQINLVFQKNAKATSSPPEQKGKPEKVKLENRVNKI